MGLVKCAFMPASMDSRLSLSKAFADSAIMGIFACAALDSLRISFAAVRPSMTGICISISTRAYSSLADDCTFSTAILPLGAKSVS